MTKEYVVIKVFNNNAVQVAAGGEDKILYGKGIGFAHKAGTVIGATATVEKVYSIVDVGFNRIAEETDAYIIEASEDMIYQVEQELGEELGEEIHLSLTDHITFMVRRLRRDEEILNPFLIQTEILYGQEFGIAQKAIASLEKVIGLRVPEGEIGFIALHIHSARSKNRLSNTIHSAFVINTLTEYIEDALGILVNKESIDYMRLVTHLRFTLERLSAGVPVRNILLEQVRLQYAGAYAIATGAAMLITDELGFPVEEDEIGFIAVYVERLKRVHQEELSQRR